MPPSLSSLKPSWLDEFRSFIMRGNVVDLAVGIIIGAAFTGVVNSLVRDVFNPLLGLATGGIDFSNVFWALNGQHYATLAEAQKAGAATLNLGLFINAIINFVIVGVRDLLGGEGADPPAAARGCAGGPESRTDPDRDPRYPEGEAIILFNRMTAVKRSLHRSLAAPMPPSCPPLSSCRRT